MMLTRRHAAAIDRLRVRLPGVRRPRPRGGGEGGQGRRAARPEAAALPGPGQAGHLPVHGRRAVARRHLRLQAEAHRRRRQGVRQGPAVRRPSSSPRRPSSSSTASPGCGSSELFPEVAKHADDLCLVHGMHTDVPNHPQAFLQMHTGIFQFPRPSLGAWVALRPGHREPEPARVRHAHPAAEQRRPGELRQPVPAGHLPGDADRVRRRNRFQCRSGGDPTQLSNIKNPRRSTAAQRAQLDFVQSLNRSQLEKDEVNPGGRGGDRVVRTGLPHAGRAAEAAGPVGRDEGDAGPVRHRRAGRPTTSASSACWPGGWSRPGCGSSR